MKFDFTSPNGLKSLNEYLISRSYIENYQYSSADQAVFSQLKNVPDKDKYINAYRWYIHIANLQGTSSFLNVAQTKIISENKDEVDDIFGDEEESIPKAAVISRAERMAAAKVEKEKKKKIEKSQVVFEVKAWEAEADLKALYSKIKSEICIDGLVWAEGFKLAPVAFGINKLVISCVIEDDKVGLNDISDAIEKYEDIVQSVDLVTMSRCS